MISVSDPHHSRDSQSHTLATPTTTCFVTTTHYGRLGLTFGISTSFTRDFLLNDLQSQHTVINWTNKCRMQVNSVLGWIFTLKIEIMVVLLTHTNAKTADESMVQPTSKRKRWKTQISHNATGFKKVFEKIPMSKCSHNVLGSSLT